MKTINYTGSSKLISRIVNLLNRKVPLPLDGDGNPDWGSNGQVLSTNGVDEAVWVNAGGGSGGHTIENTSGADLPQEDNLQFVGVYTEDDSANDRTKVNIVRQMTKAAMETLSSAEKEGFIDTTDEDDDYIPISAEDVKYGNTDVESKLDALTTDVSGKVSKSGDTMTGALTIQNVSDAIILKRNNNAYSGWIGFYNNYGLLGYYGMGTGGKPLFIDIDGNIHQLLYKGGGARTVTTLVNESTTIASGSTKTYSALTLSALQAYDELTFMFASGNVLFNGSMTKAQLNMIAGISSGKMYIFGGQIVASGSVSLDYKCKVYANASGLSILNQSVSSSIDKVLIEGITY